MYVQGKVDKIDIFSDEDGFELLVTIDDGAEYKFSISDAEQLYNEVKAEIGPWLHERDMGSATYQPRPGSLTDLERNVPNPNGGYESLDPKSEGYHDRMSAIHDNKERA